MQVFSPQAGEERLLALEAGCLASSTDKEESPEFKDSMTKASPRSHHTSLSQLSGASSFGALTSTVDTAGRLGLQPVPGWASALGLQLSAPWPQETRISCRAHTFRPCMRCSGRQFPLRSSLFSFSPLSSIVRRNQPASLYSLVCQRCLKV